MATICASALWKENGPVVNPVAYVSQLKSLLLIELNEFKNGIFEIKMIAVDCGEPPYLNNAIASFNSTQFESQVIYSCINENFYVNSSNPQISCQATGNWPKLTFECIGDLTYLSRVDFSI
jgi:hypothetical protein